MCRCIRLTLSSNVSRSVDAPPGPAAALDSSTRFFVRFAWSFLPTSAADIPTSGPASNAPLGHQQPRPSTRGGGADCACAASASSSDPCGSTDNAGPSPPPSGATGPTTRARSNSVAAFSQLHLPSVLVAARAAHRGAKEGRPAGLPARARMAPKGQANGAPDAPETGHHRLLSQNGLSVSATTEAHPRVRLPNAHRTRSEHEQLVNTCVLPRLFSTVCSMSAGGPHLSRMVPRICGGRAKSAKARYVPRRVGGRRTSREHG